MNCYEEHIDFEAATVVAGLNDFSKKSFRDNGLILHQYNTNFFQCYSSCSDFFYS